MSDWTEYALAWAFFLTSHALPARPALRARLTAALGSRVYLAVYMSVSLAALCWLIVAAGRAPFIALWDATGRPMLAPPLCMAPACLLVAFTLGAPNPLSFGGAHAERFDPERPGVVGAARHPLLWALALWSGAHLAANGDVAHATLFGGFLSVALLGMPMLDRRVRRRVGAAEWARLAARSSDWPLQAWVAGRWRPGPVGPAALLRVAAAAAAWLALVVAHPAVIGVAALAR